MNAWIIFVHMNVKIQMEATDVNVEKVSERHQVENVMISMNVPLEFQVAMIALILKEGIHSSFLYLMNEVLSQMLYCMKHNGKYKKRLFLFLVIIAIVDLVSVKLKMQQDVRR